MSGSNATHEDTHDPAGHWTPRLGDLAYASRTGRTGVAVDVPGPDADRYHLRPEEGGAGDEWAAPADGSTLSPQNAEDAG